MSITNLFPVILIEISPAFKREKSIWVWLRWGIGLNVVVIIAFLQLRSSRKIKELEQNNQQFQEQINLLKQDNQQLQEQIDQLNQDNKEPNNLILHLPSQPDSIN